MIKPRVLPIHWWLFAPPLGYTLDYLLWMRRTIKREIPIARIPPPDFLIRAEKIDYPKGKTLERYEIDLDLKIDIPHRSRKIVTPNPTVSVIELPDGRTVYRLDEPELADTQRGFYHRVLRRMMEKFVGNKDMPKIYSAVVEAWMKGAEKRLKKKWTKERSGKAWNEAQRIVYHLARDLSSFALLLPLIKDPNIEDISIDRAGKPVYVVPRRYGIHIPTNVVFQSEEEVKKIIRKLVFESGKHISYSTPHQEAQLPDGSRMIASFGSEITPMGSTCSIRKFRRFPFSPIELIHLGTLSLDMAVYLWFCVEYRKSTLIYGVTGAGKSSLLNSISSFLPFGEKIVTIESRQELNIPYPHVISRVARESYTRTGKSYSIEELLAESLWELPTVIIVGEIRRGEALTYFNALSSGHGGLCTIHAGSFGELINRLLAAPCNVPVYWILCTKVFVEIRKFRERPFPIRRVVSIKEPNGKVDDVRRRVGSTDVFNWDARKVGWTSRLESSHVVREICSELGITFDEFMSEFESRKRFLSDLLESYRKRLESDRPVLIEDFFEKVSLYGARRHAG